MNNVNGTKIILQCPRSPKAFTTSACSSRWVVPFRGRHCKSFHRLSRKKGKKASTISILTYKTGKFCPVCFSLLVAFFSYFQNHGVCWLLLERNQYVCRGRWLLHSQVLLRVQPEMGSITRQHWEACGGKECQFHLPVVYFHEQNSDLVTNVDFLRSLRCVSGCFVKHLTLQWGRSHRLCVRQAEGHWAAGSSQGTPADTQLSSSDGKLDCGMQTSPGAEAVLALQAG